MKEFELKVIGLRVSDESVQVIFRNTGEGEEVCNLSLRVPGDQRAEYPTGKEFFVTIVGSDEIEALEKLGVQLVEQNDLTGLIEKEPVGYVTHVLDMVKNPDSSLTDEERRALSSMFRDEFLNDAEKEPQV